MTRSRPVRRAQARSASRRTIRALTLGVLPALVAVTVMAAPHAIATVSGATQIFAWGENGQGSLGNSTTVQSSVPVATVMTGALAGQTIAQASAGAATSCAVTTAGVAYCWGMGLNGELGNGANLSSTVPVAVSTSGVLAGKTMVQIEVYSNSVCALSSDGLVSCWGANTFDQLGTGSSTGNSNLPVAVTTSPALSGRTVTALSRGGFSTVCAILDDGSAACWGSGLFGSMGNGTNAVANASPVAVTMTGVMTGKRFASIAGSTFAMHALTTDGVLVAWGRNNSGQLGNDSLSDANLPVLTSSSGALNGLTASSIDAGGERACVVTTTARAFCWGSNANGAFGTGVSGTTSKIPTAALTTGVLSGVSIQQVSIGTETVCALTSGGSLGCTGQGSVGELGDGTNTSFVTSAVGVNTSGVLLGKSISGISVGDYHVMAWGTSDTYDPQSPVDVMQQVGLPMSGSCADVDRADLNWSGVPSGGWGRSWAEWANDHSGGDVCVRTLYYRSGAGRWAVRT